MQKTQAEIEAEIKERLEHQDVLKDIKLVLTTSYGKNFVKYLLKSFEVAELPPIGWEGSLLMDKLGFLRAGNSIFKIVSEANPEVAGQLLAQIEKEKHVQAYNDQIQSS